MGFSTLPSRIDEDRPLLRTIAIHRVRAALLKLRRFVEHIP
jgi:hypothetical protein